MPGFDRTGIWVESPISNHSSDYHVKLIDAEKYDSSADVEIGYRPFIHAMQSRSFNWKRLFGWLWNKSLS